MARSCRRDCGVQLEETWLTLIPGEERLLRAAVQPWSVTDRSLTWTSSNPAVASVDADGNITAHRNGEASITATAVADPVQGHLLHCDSREPPGTAPRRGADSLRRKPSVHLGHEKWRQLDCRRRLGHGRV